MATRSARKTGISEGWTVKTKNENGTVTWINGEFEEITLHETTVPNETTLAILAANGIIPQVPNAIPRGYVSGEVPFELDGETESDDEDNALSRVLSRVKSAPSDLRSEVRLHRVKADGKLSYCAKFTVEEYDEGGEELIRGAFGAGTYRVMVYGPSMQDGSNYGKFVRLANQLVEIEPSLVPLSSKSGGENGQINGTVAQLLIEQIRALQEQINKPVASADPMAMFEQFARIQKMLGGNQPQKQQSITEIIRELEAVKKFKDGLTGEDGGKVESPDMMTLASQVLTAITDKKNQQPAIAGQVAPTLAIPQNITLGAQLEQSNPNLQPNESEDMNTSETFMANIMLGALLKAAQRGDAVESHAAGLADKLPDEVLDVLEMPIWFDSLTEMFPQHAPALQLHKLWFEALRNRINELTIDPEDKPG